MNKEIEKLSQEDLTKLVSDWSKQSKDRAVILITCKAKDANTGNFTTALCGEDKMVRNTFAAFVKNNLELVEQVMRMILREELSNMDL